MRWVPFLSAQFETTHGMFCFFLCMCAKLCVKRSKCHVYLYLRSTPKIKKKKKLSYWWIIHEIHHITIFQMGNYSMLLILNLSCQYHVNECSERVSLLYWRHCSTTQTEEQHFFFYCSVNLFSLQMFQINWTWYFSSENYPFCCCHCHSIRFFMRRKNSTNFCFRNRFLLREKSFSAIAAADVAFHCGL